MCTWPSCMVKIVTLNIMYNLFNQAVLHLSPYSSIDLYHFVSLSVVFAVVIRMITIMVIVILIMVMMTFVAVVVVIVVVALMKIIWIRLCDTTRTFCRLDLLALV